MPVPTCPICGCEAADLSRQGTRSVAQSIEKSDAGVVICHCQENHRFVVSVVSLEERVPTKAVVRRSKVSCQ